MRYLLIFTLSIIAFQTAIGQQKRLEFFIEEYANKNNFNGTIYIQKDSSQLYYKSFGLADRRFGIPIINETIYKVASITKAFTAVLILQLYEEGKLEMNKPFNTYLPDFKGEASSKVTIHQLLNHTSGMRQIDTISSLDNAFKFGLGYLQKPNTSDQLLDSFKKYSLVNEPGEKWEYNNYEYIVLGKIIEKLYGKTFEQVLKEKILVPLEMNQSGMLKEKAIVANLASTYFIGKHPDTLMTDIPVYIENWYAAGSMYSCADDLIKFSNALFELKLINEESLDRMLEPGLENYGYGVWIKGQGNQRRMERYGRIMGANAVWMRFLNNDITIIILSNTNMTNLGEYALNAYRNMVD